MIKTFLRGLCWGAGLSVVPLLVGIVVAQIQLAGGPDIAGQFVIGLRGVPISAVPLQNGQVLTYVSPGNRWVPK